jgi:hypothetical protein
LWLVKHAQLDFQVKETPYSLRLSQKKKVAQHWNPQTQFHHQQIPETQGLFPPGQHRITESSSSQTYIKEKLLNSLKNLVNSSPFLAIRIPKNLKLLKIRSFLKK